MLKGMNFSEIPRNSNLSLVSRSTGEAGPSGVKPIRDDPDFARIEELIKGNTFSRDEISRLVEILNSRVEDEQEENKSGHSAGEDARRGSLMHVIPRTPTVEKQQDFARTMVGTSLQKTDGVPVGVGVSPIDVARAFMAGRTSEQDHNPYSFTSKGERTRMSNEFAQKPLVQSPSSKPSICWPGAMVHNHNGYTTPQSERRYGLRDFPRTPYSRTSLSKSTTKLQVDSWGTSTSTPFQQSQASIFGQVRSKGETVDGYGSVGPIRRIRNKFASEIRPRGSVFLKSPEDVPSKRLKTNTFESSLPIAEKNRELGETSDASKYRSVNNVSDSSNVGFGNQNSMSSEAVKKILEHLDRNKPTPKEKEAELKLATAWRSSSTPGATDTIHEENISSRHFREFSHESTAITGPLAFTKSSSSSLLKFHNSGLDKANNAGKDSAEASGSVFSHSSRTPGANVMPPFSLNGNSDALRKKETSLQFPPPHPDNGKDLKSVTNPAGSELSKNHGTKRSLPSIAINKPYPRAVSSAENGPGFTFPFTASSGFLSEPPTPSMPSASSVSIPSQAPDVPAIPSYGFGTNKSSPRLAFSFASTSNALTPEDSDLKFTFGSEKTRLSFNSFEKNATCY